MLEHKFVQITPFLLTFVPIVHEPLAPQPSVQPVPPQKCGHPKSSKLNPVPGSKAQGLNVQRMGWSTTWISGFGCRQHKAAVQAAECAALGLAQTQTAPKQPVGWPRKDKEDLNSMFVELQASVSLLTLYFVCHACGTKWVCWIELFKLCTHQLQQYHLWCVNLEYWMGNWVCNTC